LTSNFSHAFLSGEYKVHRENVLLDQERALFVETQPFVENQILREKNDAKMKEMQQIIQKYNGIYSKLMDESRRLSRKQTHERQQFVRACPKDGCNGFLNQQWKCGICETKHCKDCHQPLAVVSHDGETKWGDGGDGGDGGAGVGDANTPPHVCNPDDVATASLLEKDTKPCPKCNMGIFKIDGCNQMFCTQCNTAFDWTTRKIANGVIHNPHYFEWLRRNSANGEIPRAPNDNVCPDNMVNHNTARRIFALIHSKYYMCETEKKHALDTIMAVCRNISHIRHVVIESYTFDYVAKNRELRIYLMRNRMSENEFKIRVQKNDKKFSKCQEIYNILQVLVNGCGDIVLRYEQSLRSTGTQYTPETANILNELPNIVKYGNECFEEIGHTYKSKPLKYTRTLDVDD
jgi:hypothetical protein